MSFFRNIEFTRHPPDDSQSRHSASPHQRSPAGPGGRGVDSPEQRSQTNSPDIDTGSHGGRSPRQLEEYAINCARRNRLSATSEEGLVEFAQVGSHPSLCIPYPHNTGQLDRGAQLVDLWSKVARVEQQTGPLETPAAGSQINLELPSIPKQTMVGIFINTRLTFADKHRESDIRYKAALILMSTAEEMNYHNTPNKPAAMIMVRQLFPVPTTA